MSGAMKNVGRVFKWTLAAFLFFGVACLLALVFFEQPVPRPVLDHLTGALSNSNILVTVESASFRFSHGLALRNVRVFERTRHPLRALEPVEPMLAADLVDLELNLVRIPWARESILKAATVTALRYPRLPEGYYIPDSIEKPGQPDFREVNEPVALDLPDIHPFRLRLVRPDVLGVAPKYVDLPHVEVSRTGLRAERVHLQWPDSDTLMTLDGGFELDLEAQLVRGEVHGLARQHNIRPMLVALDITNSYQFIDAFTEVERPVSASCQFDVNLRNNDLHLLLGLHPVGGRNRGVPLKKVDGTVDIRVFVRDTFQNADIHVNIDRAELADGTALRGVVRYENTNDVGFVDFDVDSATSIANALAIADAMNDGTLDCLCVTGRPPRVTLRGRLAVDPAHGTANNLDGTIAFDAGTLFGVPLRRARAGFAVRGRVVSFSDARAEGPHGGTVTGDGVISTPGDGQPLAGFNVNIACTNVPLRDLAETFSIDIGGKNGYADGRITLAGPVDTNALSRLNGNGRVVFRDGLLAQKRAFEGLFSFLAHNVPGASRIIDPSGAALASFTRSAYDFTLSNGVFRTQNLVLEGKFMSIKAAGSYDIPADKLDFKVAVKLLKWDLGGLPNPVSLVSQSLLDFTVTGPIDNPRWVYSRNPLKLLQPLDHLRKSIEKTVVPSSRLGGDGKK